MTITRLTLRKDLQALGFTYREARDIVNVIVKVLSEKLKTEGVLDTPMGTLTLHEPKPRRAYRLGKIVTIYKKKKVHFKSKKG